MNSLMSVMYVKLVLRAEAEGERNLRNRLDRPDVVVRLAVVGYVSRRFGSVPDECTGTRNDESCRARSDGRKNVYGIYGQQSVR